MDPADLTFLMRSTDPDLEFRVAPGQSVVLGRALDADVVVRDRRLSQSHCRFSIEGGELFVQDLKSRNLTLINGAALPPDQSRRLVADDRVRICDYDFVVAIDTPVPIAGATPD